MVVYEAKEVLKYSGVAGIFGKVGLKSVEQALKSPISPLLDTPLSTVILITVSLLNNYTLCTVLHDLN